MLTGRPGRVTGLEAHGAVSVGRIAALMLFAGGRVLGVELTLAEGEPTNAAGAVWARHGGGAMSLEGGLGAGYAGCGGGVRVELGYRCAGFVSL